jgi:hypothetical protein
LYHGSIRRAVWCKLKCLVRPRPVATKNEGSHLKVHKPFVFGIASAEALVELKSGLI